jgi:hypothetical protein
LLIAVIAIVPGNTPPSVTSVTDQAGDTFVPVASPTTRSTFMQVVYYAADVAGGTTRITTQLDTAAQYEVRTYEYTGLAATPLELSVVASGQAVTATSAPLTTTNAHDLLFSASTTGHGATAPGGGFTLRAIVNGDLDEDLIATSASTFMSSEMLDADEDYIISLSAFRGAR